ncbi:hypothetical protein D3C81_623000 [compost metagenome]
MLTDRVLVLQFGEGAVELFGVEIAVVLRLMIEQNLVALLHQDAGLFDGFFGVLQALAQLADVSVVDPQQVFEATVIQFRMAGAPVSDFADKITFLVLQCLQPFLLRLEFGGDLHLLREDALPRLGGRGFCAA